MKEALIDLFSQPLVIGLFIGLAVALLISIKSFLRARNLKLEAAAKEDRYKAEIEGLQKHLHTQMEITAKGNDALKAELQDAKDTNNNLSQALGALKQKPGRAEIRSLHLYEKSIRIMNTRAPGFGSAWESALQEAEAEIKKEESGLMGWIKKPFLMNKASSADTSETVKDV
ncbi:MAG: hypothetical protein ACSHYA_11245 [Opitutaceae bacterium]